MKALKIAALLVAGLVPVAAAHASINPCPTPNGGSSGSEGLDSTYAANISANGSCNVIITFGTAGSIVSSTPNGQLFYDSGGDDALIGIVNSSGSTITSINLSSSNQDIFGFDGDGICGGYTFASGGVSGCTPSSSDPTEYAPLGVTFTNDGSGYSGTVNFAGGIANGSTAYFSLEDAVTLNSLTISPPVTTSATPEPSSLILLGTGALGVAGSLRRRFVRG